MSVNDLKPKPRISMIIPLPVSLLLLIFFFLPWLTVSCDAGELTKEMQRTHALEMPPTSPIPGIPKVTAEVGEASGWQLAKGDISLKGAYVRQESPLGADNDPLKSRPGLYIGLVAPILALLLSGLGAAGNANARTVGTALLLLGIVGTGAVLWAASIDYVDDTVDKLQEQVPQSRCGGPAPCQPGVDDAKANMKKLIKTEGTVYLWGSLGMYALLAGCGIAGRRVPVGPRFRRETAAVPRVPGVRSPERVRRPGADRLPDFGPDLTPKEPAHKTEEAAAPEKRLYVLKSKDGA